MKAIVMTCDTYRPFTLHMLKTYEKHWPSNTFTFRIPYNEDKGDLENKSNIELIKSPKHIKHTVLKLLEDIPDEEWIYWCIDDKYLVNINEKKVNKLQKWILTQKDPTLAGVKFYSYGNYMRCNCLRYNNKIDEPWEMIETRDYYMIWINHYVKAGIIRHLFNHFPDTKYPARKMDSFLRDVKLPEGKKGYVLKENLCVTGESTTKGKITQNCSDSFKSYNMTVPKNFKLSKKTIFRGRDMYSEYPPFQPLWKQLIKKLKL